MNEANGTIDAGKPFDFGKTASDYAKYRDIYPAAFYQKILDRDLCVKGQRVLDVGTESLSLRRGMDGDRLVGRTDRYGGRAFKGHGYPL